jgi:hypothetical protein
MKVMTAHIIFEAFKGLPEVSLRRPSGVQVESSWQRLTDTAVIVLPRNVKDFDKQKVKEVFKTGRPVTIKLGYNGENETEFTGYITKVSADIPIKIQCEDEMYQLKKIPVHLSTKAINLQDLIKKIVPGYDTDVERWDMPPQRYVHTTAAKVLEFLKKEYKLYSYFVGKKLVVGKIYSDDTSTEPVKLNLEANVRSNNLKYRHKDDIEIKIRAISTLRNGSKLEAVVGDTGGTEKQLAYYGITVKAELEKQAKRAYDLYKVDGFDGSLSTFGQPVIRHGMKVDLSSHIYPDRNGRYYVDSVRVSFDNNGYARELKLGQKL